MGRGICPGSRFLLSSRVYRQLKRPSDFEAFLGSEVEVRTYKPINGQKAFVGTLEKYEDGAVTLSSGKKQIRLEKQDIALVKLHVSF